MILLWGLSSERPIHRVGEELHRLGARFELLDQWNAAETAVELSVAGNVSGTIRCGEQTIDISEVTGLYARPYDWRVLAAARRIEENGRAWKRIGEVEEALYAWWEVANGTVVNPPSAMASNSSKPYQSKFIRAAGFSVPSTIVTTDPAVAQDFWDKQGVIVYKSVSGVRSRVARLTREHAERLHDIASCPTQFQEYVPGTDVRVHVIGEEVFATEVVSDATDYRYASSADGKSPELRAVRLPEGVLESCVLVTPQLGLRMSGIDLRRTPDGEWFCFEVNPSPGFTFFESGTGQPLAAATARLLAGCGPAASRPVFEKHRAAPPASSPPVDPGEGRRPFIRAEERPPVGLDAVEALVGRSSEIAAI